MFSYLAESHKIVNYNLDGKITSINLDKHGPKIPDMATPVPFESAIYLLDPCVFDQKRKVFVPDNICYRIGQDERLTDLKAAPSQRRMKSAIVRDK